MDEHFYYIDPRGRRSGPFSEAELRRMAATGLLERSGSLELAAFGNVLRIEESTWLLPSFPQEPPPAAPRAAGAAATADRDVPTAGTTVPAAPVAPPDAAPGTARRSVADESISAAFATHGAGPSTVGQPAAPERFAMPMVGVGQGPTAPPTEPAQDLNSPEERQRPIERATYILLGVLPAIVGIFGIHNVVAGYVGRGIVQLVLSLFTLGGLCIGLAPIPCACLGIPLWLGLFVWTVCDVSLVRRDARGRPFA